MIFQIYYENGSLPFIFKQRAPLYDIRKFYDGEIIQESPEEIKMEKTGRELKLIIRFFLIFILILLSNCVVKEKLRSTPDFSISNYESRHYLYEDNMIALSAQIQPSEIPGGYEYALLIINRGSSPLPLNYYQDILTMSYGNKIYSLRKITRAGEYPGTLVTGHGFVVYFQIDGTFSPQVYNIEYLIFKMGEKRYILKRNPQAVWKDKEKLY